MQKKIVFARNIAGLENVIISTDIKTVELKKKTNNDIANASSDANTKEVSFTCTKTVEEARFLRVITNYLTKKNFAAVFP